MPDPQIIPPVTPATRFPAGYEESVAEAVAELLAEVGDGE